MNEPRLILAAISALVALYCGWRFRRILRGEEPYRFVWGFLAGLCGTTSVCQVLIAVLSR